MNFVFKEKEVIYVLDVKDGLKGIGNLMVVFEIEIFVFWKDDIIRELR